MQTQLGRIGTVRRAIRGKACPLCGGYTYHLIVRSSSVMADSSQLAHCSHCGRARQLDDGFWKNLVNINVADCTTAFAKPLEFWERYGTRPQAAWDRSLTVSPNASLTAPVPFYAVIDTWRTRALQLTHELGIAESYVKLHSCGSRLIQWLRRELSSFSYFSRI